MIDDLQLLGAIADTAARERWFPPDVLAAAVVLLVQELAARPTGGAVPANSRDLGWPAPPAEA